MRVRVRVFVESLACCFLGGHESAVVPAVFPFFPAGEYNFCLRRIVGVPYRSFARKYQYEIWGMLLRRDAPY